MYEKRDRTAKRMLAKGGVQKKRATPPTPLAEAAERRRRKKVYREIIAKSKLHRSERKRQKAKYEVMREELDAEFRRW